MFLGDVEKIWLQKFKSFVKKHLLYLSWVPKRDDPKISHNLKYDLGQPLVR